MDPQPLPEITPMFDAPVSVTTASYFVAYQYQGLDNGLPKSGFESKVIVGPGNGFTDHKELKELSDALINAFFETRKWIDLELNVINVIRLPI